MRMDRYDEDEVKERVTRTNKNQELYTDVYLNNAYVDISDLKEVMDTEEEEVKEVKDTKKEEISYNYEEKNYDIVSIIDEAIKNNEDKVKRSIENDEEVENIIESINESQREKAADETLLSDLMPDRDTEVIPPLETPILDTSIYDTSDLHKDEMSNELANIDNTLSDNDKTIEGIIDLKKLDEDEEDEEDLVYEYPIKKEKDIEDEEVDNSFALDTKSPKKIIFIILGIILVIGIIIGILIWKKVIKF